MSYDAEEPVILPFRQACPVEFRGMGMIKPIQDMGKTFVVCVIHGGPGTRKTTQLWAIQQYCLGRPMTAQERVHVMAEAADIDRHRFSMEWLDAWCSWPGILCIDDVGYKQPNDWNVQALYAILNIRGQHKRRTVITTNHDKDKIHALYGEPIASRMFRDVVIGSGTTDMRGVRSPATWQQAPAPTPQAQDGAQQAPYDPHAVYRFYQEHPERIGPTARLFIKKYEAKQAGPKQPKKTPCAPEVRTAVAVASAVDEVLTNPFPVG